MNAPSSPIDPAYERYASFVRALHRLFLEGKGESDEADALRDQMDEPWEALTEEQRALVSGLTADLNWIRREPARSHPERDEVLTEDLPKMGAAIEAGDWRVVLEILRRAAPRLARPYVAELRARAWEGLGDHESGRLFAQHATGARPTPAWAQNNRLHIPRSPRFVEAPR
jgi:hypothetical protein